MLGAREGTLAGFGDMAQRSRAHAVPAEDQGSILSTHMQLPTAVPRDLLPSSGLCGYQVCM